VTVEPSASHRSPPLHPVLGRVRLAPSEAAIFETFVVPRYLSLFGELALEMMVESDDAQVAHLYCRTGYPDRGITLKLPTAHVLGADPSSAALELARAKASTMPAMVSEYRFLEALPTRLPQGAFSHALTLHPLASAQERGKLLAEFARLLGPHGQALMAMPLRGSFQELFDLLREYALKYDDDAVVRAVEEAQEAKPTLETFRIELEEAGFDFVEVSLRPTILGFRSGRDFFEDPVTRLLILPDMKLNLNLADPDKAFDYVREAIDKYWSDGTFELTVNVGCASGRRVP
jgi:SAM-dependent methyltransferase